MKLLFLVLPFVFSSLSSANQITLAPGAEILIDVSQPTTVRCEGTSVAASCRCKVGNMDDSNVLPCDRSYAGWVLLKEGAPISSSRCYGDTQNRRQRLARECFAQIPNEALCN